RTPSVVTLYTHLQGEQNVVFEETATVAERAAAAAALSTQLMCYFARPDDPRFDALTYLDYFEQYTITKPEKGRQTNSKAHDNSFTDKKGNVVKPRKQEQPVARLSLMEPTQGDVWYLRLLLSHRAARSFEAMRAVNNELHETNEGAARALGLVHDDHEYAMAIEEAKTFLTGSELRRLFVSLLLDGASGATLWQEYWEDFTEDLSGRLGDEDAITEALRRIDLALRRTGRDNKSVGLPPATHTSNEIQRHQAQFHLHEQLRIATEGYQTLNEAQRTVFDLCTESVNAGAGKIIMAVAPGGTGKTYTTNLIAAHVRSQGKIVLCVASTGIAALQMPSGWTAHSMFRLPLDDKNVEGCMCNVSTNSDRGQLLAAADLIIWDEITMSHRFSVEALDRTLQDLTGNDTPFGGKTVLFSGDWRQTAPVVKNGRTEHDAVNASFVTSPLFELTIKKHLTRAVREQGDPDYAAYVRSVGEDRATRKTMPDGASCIALALPDGTPIQVTTSTDDLQHFVYGDV
ncbi:unnamed protein product, partial [Phaeothamnion confervicola]